MNEEQARAYCETMASTSEALMRLERFSELLRSENARQNLVSNSSLDFIWQRHFADSLQLLEHVSGGPSSWIDLGTGAGMPGLIIALARPDMPIVLVESRKKRVTWLESICGQFQLTNCKVIGSKLEEVATAPFAVVSARAFAPLDKLLKLSMRFSTPNTVWVLPKGRSAGIELSRQPEPVREMFHVEPSRTDGSAGILVGKGIPPIS